MVKMRYFGLARIIPGILIVTFFLCRFYDVPSYVSSILTFCWILFVPFTIGSFLLRIPSSLFNKVYFNILSIGISGIIVRWFIGLATITALAYAILLNQSGLINVMGPLLLILTGVSCIVARPSNAVLYSKLVLNLKSFHVRIGIIVIMLGIIFGLYIRSFSPYPLSPGIDVFNHMFIIQSILNNAFVDLPLSYLPTVDTIIALAASTYDADLSSLFWMGSIFVGTCFALSCFIMIYYFSRNLCFSLLGVVIALPLTEHGFAANIQFFYPASIMMSIFPLMIFVIDNIWKTKNRANLPIMITLTIIVFSVLLLIHAVLGSIICLILIIYLFFSYSISKHNRLFFLLRIVTITSAIILMGYYLGYISDQFQVALIKSNQFESQHLYNTFTKIMNLDQWYTNIIMTLSLVGFIVLSFHKKKEIVVLNLIGIVLLLIYFQQISYIHRIIPLERVFISFAASAVIALPILILISIVKDIRNNGRVKKLFEDSKNDYTESSNSHNLAHLNNKIRSLINFDKLGLIPIFEMNHKILFIIAILVFVVLFPFLLQPYDIYLNVYLSNGFNFTNYTHDELLASQWISENIPEDYKIYSDPSTVLEMRGLSHRPNIEQIGWNTTVATEVKSVFQSENSKYAYENIISSHGKELIIVITPKTAQWIISDQYFYTLPVTEFKIFPGLNKFYNEKYFNLEYAENNVYLFTLK